MNDTKSRRSFEDEASARTGLMGFFVNYEAFVNSNQKVLFMCKERTGRREARLFHDVVLTFFNKSGSKFASIGDLVEMFNRNPWKFRTIKYINMAEKCTFDPEICGLCCFFTL